jgi:hypothetical protein
MTDCEGQRLTVGKLTPRMASWRGTGSASTRQWCGNVASSWTGSITSCARPISPAWCGFTRTCSACANVSGRPPRLSRRLDVRRRSRGDSHMVGVAEQPRPEDALRLEHFAFAASGFAEFVARLQRLGICFQQSRQPGTGNVHRQPAPSRRSNGCTSISRPAKANSERLERRLPRY